MPKRTLRQVVTGQTLVSALPDTTVRAAAVAMANQSVGAILVVNESGRFAHVRLRVFGGVLAACLGAGCKAEGKGDQKGDLACHGHLLVSVVIHHGSCGAVSQGASCDGWRTGEGPRGLRSCLDLLCSAPQSVAWLSDDP